jgi:leucyl/phenylalanyl-tRNA--protein transferase
MQRRSPAFLAAQSHFPDPSLYGPEELIAVSESFTPEMCLRAYPKGIFPWFEQEGFIFWFCTHPRMVLRPQDVYVSKSMRKLIREERFQITRNESFPEVMRHCAEVPRGRDNESWISERFHKVYGKLRELGVAQSVEAWEEGELVGGLYGLKVGRVFYGESMFSLASNASKAAFISLCSQLEKEGVHLIDCQVPSQHLASLGGRVMDKTDFLNALKALS